MTPNPKLRELIMSMGIIPESEHYDIAERVIQECIEIVEPCKCGCRCEQEVNITDSIIADIKEHFGVEQ